MSKLKDDAEKVLLKKLEPIKIKNQDAYREFIELSNSSILNEKKFITASDGETYNIGHLSHNLLKKIKHLPLKEQKAIMVIKKEHDTTHARRNGAYRRAYGTILNKNGETKKSQFYSSPVAQRKDEIVELFGRMFSVKEVHEICVKDWDLKISPSTLAAFREMNKVLILQKIEEHKKTYDEVRIGQKRSRLEELTWLYEKRKRMYDATKKGEDHRLLLQTLEQIRKEVEGDTLRIDGNRNFNMELTIRNQIEEETLKHALIKEIIVSRVSAKMGADPMLMMNAIKSSYYRKRIEAPTDIPHEEIEYPSSSTYDFNKIEAINKELEIKQKNDIAEFKEKTEQKDRELSSKTEDIKNRLIERLTGKKQAVKTLKNSAFFKSLEREKQEE